MNSVWEEDESMPSSGLFPTFIEKWKHMVDSLKRFYWEKIKQISDSQAQTQNCY